MENATDALLIAFAILIFIIALTVTLSTLSQAKSTADIVLFTSDREMVQTYLGEPEDLDNEITLQGGRIVGIDTVIATIARTSKEIFAVKIEDDSETYIFEYNSQSRDEIENEIKKFIKEHEGKKYKETYVEVTTSGTVYVENAGGDDEKVSSAVVIDGGDGTRLEQNTGKKMFITFKKIS